MSRPSYRHLFVLQSIAAAGGFRRDCPDPDGARECVELDLLVGDPEGGYAITLRGADALNGENRGFAPMLTPVSWEPESR